MVAVNYIEDHIHQFNEDGPSNPSPKDKGLLAYALLVRYQDAIKAIKTKDSSGLDFSANIQSLPPLCKVLGSYLSGDLNMDEAVQQLRTAYNQAEIYLREHGFNPDFERAEMKRFYSGRKESAKIRKEMKAQSRHFNELLKKADEMIAEYHRKVTSD